MTPADTFFERLNTVLSAETAANLGRRLELLSAGAFVPDSNAVASLATLAAMLDLSIDGVQSQLASSGAPRFGAGRSILYKLRSLAEPRRQRAEPGPDDTDSAKKPRRPRK